MVYLIIVSIISLIFPLESVAARGRNYGLYFGTQAGYAFDTGKDLTKVKGPSYGLNLGYRWVNWAVELGYSKFNLKAKTGQAPDFFIEKAEVDASTLDLSAKAFLLRYITLGAGINKVSTRENIFLRNIYDDPYASSSSVGKKEYLGLYWQAGLVLPLFKWLDLWLVYQDRNLNSDSYDFKIKQYSSQLNFYF